jgi:hypothetical protein
MKILYPLFFCFLLLCSCSTDSNDLEIEIENSQKAAPQTVIMSVNCIDPAPSNPFPPYTGYLSWNRGLYIPYPMADAYIEIEPLNSGSTYPVVQIPIPYIPVSGSFNVIHNPTSVSNHGDVWMVSGDVHLHNKHFNYRYIIYDNDTSAYQTTPWKYFNLID